MARPQDNDTLDSRQLTLLTSSHTWSLTSRPGGTIEPITLNALRRMRQPRSWPVNKELRSLAAQGEGKAVVLMGFLLKAKKEGAESCNCGIMGGLKIQTSIT